MGGACIVPHRRFAKRDGCGGGLCDNLRCRSCLGNQMCFKYFVFLVKFLIDITFSLDLFRRPLIPEHLTCYLFSGQTSCIDCPSGTFHDAQGSTTMSDCGKLSIEFVWPKCSLALEFFTNAHFSLCWQELTQF